MKLVDDPVSHPSHATVAFAAGGAQIAVGFSPSRIVMLSTADVALGGGEDAVRPVLSHPATQAAATGAAGVRCIDTDASGDWIVVGLADAAEARLYSAHSLAFEKTLVRATTPVHAVRFRPQTARTDVIDTSGSVQVAVGGEDTDIWLVDIDNIANAVVMRGHKETVRSLEFSGDGNFLVRHHNRATHRKLTLGRMKQASVDILGDLYIWDLRGPKPLISKVLKSTVPRRPPGLVALSQVSNHLTYVRSDQ
ncbi:hypothetical protein HDU84_001540 [Entophlyctis sp. JEL0112]|nr:hypothetical protein HDU84_001540 [Entophlyctis sp. JEL0112]